MSETTTRFVDDSLFVPEAEHVALRGARCGACRTTTFPHQNSCPRCGGVDMSDVALPRTGHIWSFTVQHFEPKSPYRGRQPFEPYGIAYVDLGPVIVESRLTASDANAISIGDPVELTVIPAFDDTLTYAFAPAGSAS